MIARSLTALLALAVALPLFGDAAEAASKRHKRAMAAGSRSHGPPATFRQEPPRMYEVRPGNWISTWGCFTDEGYGRIGSCDRRQGRTSWHDIPPDLEVLLAFTAAGIVLVITPGPDMTLFLGQTLTGGRARGIAAYLGASAGLVVHTMLAAFGLSALLARSATAFGVLKVVGVAYLVWLAIDALRHGSALTLKPDAARRSRWHACS